MRTDGWRWLAVAALAVAMLWVALLTARDRQRVEAEARIMAPTTIYRLDDRGIHRVPEVGR